MKDKPGYYGILPANVRYDKRIKPMARIMYTEITALSNKWGYCTANNSYFAELYEVSPSTVSRWLSQLSKCGYVKIDIDESKGNERRVYPNDQNVKTSMQKDQKGIDEKVKRGIDEKIIYNTTSINTTSIIERTPAQENPHSLNSSKRKRFTPPTVREVEAYMLKSLAPDTAKKQSNLFFNYYEANGWKVGRNKMQSWPHAVGGWIARMDNYLPSKIKNNGSGTRTSKIINKEKYADAIAATAAKFGAAEAK